MKTLLSLLLTLPMATPALAQGKVRLVNDSLHLVYFDPDPGYLLPGDQGLAGQVYLFGEGQETLRIELWSGTASTSLSLVATTDFTGQPGPGVWNGLNVTLPTAGGATFFAVDIIGGTGGGRHYYGTSGLFTAVSSSTIAYNSLVNHNSPALSTWTDGTYALDSVSPGFRGAILITAGPEPSAVALGFLGFALLLVRRRAVWLRLR